MNATAFLGLVLVLCSESGTWLVTAQAAEPPCTVHVAARQAKGYVSGYAYIYRKREWEEAGIQKVDWNQVKDYSLDMGTATFHVAPGVYRVELTIADPKGRKQSEELHFAGCDEASVMFDTASGDYRYRTGDRRGDMAAPAESGAAADRDYKPPRVVDTLLDASLRRAGIDPASELAIRAKQLGKDTLNPFKSASALQEDIDRLVDATTKGN